MSWKFDPFIMDIIWVPSMPTLTDLANINFGDQIDGDMDIDLGDRSNNISDIDQGLRVIDDGNI